MTAAAAAAPSIRSWTLTQLNLQVLRARLTHYEEQQKLKNTKRTLTLIYGSV